MEYIFITLLVLGFYHFICEGILAPSARLRIRYELFASRDRLRNLMIEHGDAMPRGAYIHMQSLINAAIDRMHRIDISSISETRIKLESDPKFKKQIDARIKKLDKEIIESGIGELSEIRLDIYRCFALSFAVNSSGWFIYAFLFVLIYFALMRIKLISASMYAGLKLSTKAILYAPGNVLDKIISKSDYIYY